MTTLILRRVWPIHPLQATDAATQSLVSSARLRMTQDARQLDACLTFRSRMALASALRRCESGQSLMEFALVLPMLLLVVFGLFTFGIAFSNFLVLEAATNVGARQLAISRTNQNTDPCSTASSAIITATPTLTRSNLTFNFVLNGASYSGTSCTSASSNMVQGAIARVTVTYPCTLTSYRWNFGPCTLTAATAEYIQ